MIPDGFGISSIRRQAEPQMRLQIVYLTSDCALIEGKLSELATRRFGQDTAIRGRRGLRA
jgi:hypothetical protein